MKLLISILFIPLASFTQTQILKPEVQMNGISLTQFGDYSNEWKLITVRYRKDTQEMRFTYANPLAYKSMNEGLEIYPDGSVFAKIGYKTGIDPAFNSSVVPSGARRFQFMVRNTDKYKETDGWGYALFNSEGELYDGDLNVQSFACAACHKLVPERNFVFSEKIEFSPFMKTIAKTYSLEKNKSHISFVELKPTNKQLIKKLTSLKIKSLFIIDGEIRTHFFSGTLDEVTPLLINELMSKDKKNFAHGFVSKDEKTYKFVSFAPKKKCEGNQVGLSIVEFRPELEKPNQLIENSICFEN
jgi:hypothetical protein